MFTQAQGSLHNVIFICVVPQVVRLFSTNFGLNVGSTTDIILHSFISPKIGSTQQFKKEKERKTTI